MVIDVVKLEMDLYTNITGSHDRWVTWLEGCSQLNLSHTLLKLVTNVLVMVEIKLFLISHDQMVNESRDSVGQILSTLITKVMVRAAELSNKNIYVLEIGASFCYKLGQFCFITY